jgi:hypothetical protein
MNLPQIATEQPRVYKYQYLYAWDRMMGSFAYWIEDQQALAEKENAPTDAVYRTDGGVWVTCRDIKSDATMERLQAMHDQYFPDPS